MGNINPIALAIRPPASPLEEYGKMLQIKQMGQQIQQQQAMAPLQQQQAQQQVQAGALENQQRQIQIQDSQAGMKAMQQWDGKDWNTLPDLIKQNGGSMQAVLGAKKTILEQQTALTNATKAQLDTNATKNDYLLGKLRAATDPSIPDEQLVPSVTGAIKQAIQDGYLDPQHAQAFAPILASGDPAKVRQALGLYEKSLMGEKEQISQSLAEKEANVKQQDIELRQKEFQATMPGGAKEPVANQELRSWLQNNPGKTAADYEVAMKKIVPAYNFNLQQGAGSGQQPLSAPQQATATAILEGRMSPPSSFALRTPYWQNIMGQVFSQDPQFSEQRAQLRKSYTVGPQSKEINAINTAMGHIGNLSDAVDALQNGNIQVLNKIGNALGVQIGQDPVTTFNTIVHRIGPEISKAYVGAGGSQGERGTTEQDFDPKLSPQQLKSNIGITATLLRSKISSLENQWDQNKSDTMPSFQDRFIMPAAKQALDKLSPQRGGTGTIRIKASDGALHDIPAANLDAAKKIDPKLEVVKQ